MSQRKVMIIGLDAATLDLIHPWVTEGRLPNIQRFMEQGAWGPLRTTIPILSPAAWSTFATGMNPGKHGIIDFCQLASDQYEARFINATDRRGATFWEVAGEQGVSGGVMNLPITYPPRSYNGFLVSCMISPGVSRRICTPPELFDDLMAASPDYAIDVEIVDTQSQDVRLQFLEKALAAEENRLKAALALYRKHRPGLFCVVFMSADRTCHYFWHYLEAARAGKLSGETEQRLGRAIQLVYEKLDEIVGVLVAEAGEDTDVLILSDHGAGPLRRGLNLRKLLAREGLLTEYKPSLLKRLRSWGIHTFAHLAPTSVKNKLKARFSGLTKAAASAVAFTGIDFSKTKAYANLDSAGIFINLKGRQPQGIVEPADYEAVRNEVIDALMMLKDPQTGAPVARKVHKREEVWSGPCLDHLPDLILEQEDQLFDIAVVSDSHGDDVFFELPGLEAGGLRRQGDHRRDGMLMAMGPHIRPGHFANANIADVPATVLAMLGCSIPEEFDGRVLSEILTDDVGGAERTKYASMEAPDQAGQDVLSDEEKALVEKRLKGLGYL